MKKKKFKGLIYNKTYTTKQVRIYIRKKCILYKPIGFQDYDTRDAQKWFSGLKHVYFVTTQQFHPIGHVISGNLNIVQDRHVYRI